MIRPFTDADAAGVVRLFLRAWAPIFKSIEQAMGPAVYRVFYPDWQVQQKEAVEAVLADSDQHVWIAERDGTPAGFVAVALHRDHDMGEISMMAGFRMLRAALEHGRGYGQGRAGGGDPSLGNTSEATVESHFSSRVDAWAWIAVGGSFLLCGLLLLRAIAAANLAAAVIMLLFTLVLAAFVLPTRYTIEDNELVVRSGVFRRRVAYSGICRVSRQGSIVASPAWSLDRLAIDFRRGPRDRTTVWISPRDPDRFMEELSNAAGLTRQGDVWIGPAADTPGKDQG